VLASTDYESETFAARGALVPRQAQNGQRFERLLRAHQLGGGFFRTTFDRGVSDRGSPIQRPGMGLLTLAPNAARDRGDESACLRAASWALSQGTDIARAHDLEGTSGIRIQAPLHLATWSGIHARVSARGIVDAKNQSGKASHGDPPGPWGAGAARGRVLRPGCGGRRSEEPSRRGDDGPGSKAEAKSTPQGRQSA